MIDIESLVFDTVFNGMRNVYSSLNITSGYVEENAVFPCVVVHEIGNEPYQRTDTDDCAENYTRVTYQIDVYSDKANTARSECKKLLALADSIMQNMKFRRQRMNEPVNTSRTIYHQYARYTAIVQAGISTTVTNNGTETTTTTFQMYRR